MNGPGTQIHSCPKIAFIQTMASGLLDPLLAAPFGGAEIRALTLAKMVTASGMFRPVFAVLPPEGSRLSSGVLQGMAAFEVPRHEFLDTALREELLDFYRSLEADAFITLGANEASHEMVRYARALGIPSVVGLASDQSLRDAVFQGSMMNDEYGTPGFHVWEALRGADQVLVQTGWQQEQLYRRVGQKGALVRNPIPKGWEEPGPPRPAAFDFDFLWVGRPSPDKNPEIVFEMAREMPDARFRMVVDGGVGAVRQPWASMIPPNVALSDRVNGLEDMKSLVAASRSIINTSPLEGFPNVMLQGAMAGCPTLFLSVDPDGWAGEHGCAASAGSDFDRFMGLLSRARTDGAWLEAMASRARERALSFHVPQAVARQLLDALEQVLPGRSERGN